ncbi:MAG: hypothetical protein EOO95_00310 [Pedobacter sp.]|nr:MAG: hypothetical protein EOO95_00310 [Pedobacter sp.]
MMKNISLNSLLVIIALVVSSFGCKLSAQEPPQFINAGFEQVASANSTLPANWGIMPVAGFTASLSSEEKHSGSYSLKMVANPTVANTYMNVVRSLAINPTQLKRIKISVYVKTENLNGSVALWCQIWDVNKKQIGFENSGMQGVTITGTSDWQKYSLNLMVNKDAKTLYFGAYTAGTGIAWFDYFTVEELGSSNEPPTAEVKKFNKDFITIVKANSIYADSIDWKSLDTDLQTLAKGLKTLEDAQVLNKYVLQALKKAGDNHSFIQNKVAVQNYASNTSTQAKPVAKILENGIGYISVPAFGSVNKELGEEFASTIQALIKKLDTANKIAGWIVDLRGNGGGNMYPMISGLGPLLDVGNLGYFVKGKTKHPWKNTKNGMGVSVKAPYTIANKNNKIAVLIGRGTGSSGEMTAISFIGQKNTKLFGEPSAGYTSANQSFSLADGSNLLLASSYVADRNLKKYMQRIYPDVEVKTTAGTDATMKAAEAWLLEK